MQEMTLDGLDARLIHALQLRPRATWATLGPVLEADPATLLRRWRRLRDSGSVYATVLDASSRSTPMALVEIDCPPSSIGAVADAVIRDPAVVNVDLTASGRQLLLQVVGRDTRALNEWVIRAGAGTTGITALRTQFVTSLVAEASAWRLRALDDATRAEFAVPAVTSNAGTHLQPHERAAVLEALTNDFRAPVNHLAAATGISERRIREILSGLRPGGELIIRVDVARRLTSWPVHCWYFLRTPANRLDSVANSLARMDEVRAVLRTVGDYNLIANYWLRELGDLHRLEQAIETSLPSATIVDRSVVTRVPKHVGYLLDDEGFATRGRVRIQPC